MSTAETNAVSPQPIKRAVLYLRVSTVSQVKTDYDPEGISIPAQRASCQRKAEQMGVEIVDEYIEAGRSGTNIEHRPVFREMLNRIRDAGDVDYVFVYKLSRLNRNRIDDAKVLMLLRKHKVSLISATESIDDTPVGQLMHGILASFNEFRSAEDGADIRYKMGQKAKNGGTLGRAPLGYENVGVKFEGREIRSVIVDTERAPLIRRVFELYATGDYSLERLHAQITDEGLTTKPFGKRPGGEVSVGKIQQMLRDPYYKGVIVYDGAEYPGRHEPLVTTELFDRVQKAIEIRAGRGSRDRKHHHYLRGSVFCGRCKARDDRDVRLIYTLARGRNGDRWEYYVCRGRQQGVCDLPYISVASLEEAVIREYASLQIPEGLAVSVKAQVNDLLGDQERTAEEVQANLKLQIAKLDGAEERLLDLAADGSLSTVKVRSRLTRLQQDRDRLRQDLALADHQLALGAELLLAAVELSSDPQELYRQAPDASRRQLNGCYYEKFYIEEDRVQVAVLTETFADLGGAIRAYEGSRDPTIRRQGTKKASPVGEALAWSTGDLLAAIALGDGSSKPSLVGLGGVEPPTSALSERLLPELPDFCGLTWTYFRRSERYPQLADVCG